MAKEEEMEKVKELIHMGKKKGFLTYDEVNTLLPPDIVSSDQIDDLMMMFGEMDIEVVDAAHKVKVSKQREEVEALPVEEELEIEAEGLGKSIDPVYMYLREMGSVSLLTREGEVEIAKRIEQGEKEVINAVLDSPLTIKEMIQLGERLRSKKLKTQDWPPSWRMRTNISSKKSSTSRGSSPSSTRSRSSTSATGSSEKNFPNPASTLSLRWPEKWRITGKKSFPSSRTSILRPSISIKSSRS